MSKIFSMCYNQAAQERFEKAFADGNLEEAVRALQSLPPSVTPEQKLDRLVVMNEGYRAIVEDYITESNEDDDELDEYRKLGTVEEISDILSKLNRLT